MAALGDIVFRMECAVCNALRRAAETLEREYANARGWLSDLAESSDAVRYQQVRRIAEDARLEYETMRLELEQHQRTHARSSAAP